MGNIVRQLSIRPQLPTIYGPKDYHELRQQIEHIDRILRVGGLEEKLICESMLKKGIDQPSAKQLETHCRALRCAILRILSGLDFRDMAVRLADSHLFQWFTGYGNCGSLGGLSSPSKSTLERFSKFFDVEDIAKFNQRLLAMASDQQCATEAIGIDAPLELDKIFADSTCITVHIHFPVDWVLLRDAVRTLIKAIQCTRRHGLKHRMPNPESFLTAINGMCMAMASSRRKSDATKQRKKILRQMKQLTKTVEEHALRYRQLLDEHWESTDWTRKQVDQILRRIDNILDQLPHAIHQAHERIIGQRPVASRDKILSLYEPDIQVILRGKAGAEVEFGNTLYLAEQENGLIVDWRFFEDRAPSDSSLVKDSITRIGSAFGPISTYTADRGFHSKANRELLQQVGIHNGIYPKGVVAQLTVEQKKLHKRRAQTEGRIGILKNVMLQHPFRSKGFASRETAISLAVLTHNLWILSRMCAEKQTALFRQAA